MSWIIGCALSGWAGEAAPSRSGESEELLVESHAWRSAQDLSVKSVLGRTARGSKLFSRSPGTLERTALLKILGKSRSNTKQYWTSKVYQGDAESEPMVLPSNGMQREALTAYPAPSR